MIEVGKPEQPKIRDQYKLKPKKSGVFTVEKVSTRSTSFLDELNIQGVGTDNMEDASFNELINEMDKQGKRFMQKPGLEELVKYKVIVRQFIDKAVHETMTCEKKEGRTIRNRQTGTMQSLPTMTCEKKEGRTIRNRQTGTMQSLPPTKLVKIIDEKMNELSLLIIQQQGKALNLAARLSEIRGLLLDMRG